MISGEHVLDQYFEACAVAGRRSLCRSKASFEGSLPLMACEEKQAFYEFKSSDEAFIPSRLQKLSRSILNGNPSDWVSLLAGEAW